MFQCIPLCAGLESTQDLERVLADVGDPPSSLEDRLAALLWNIHLTACVALTTVCAVLQLSLQVPNMLQQYCVSLLAQSPPLACHHPYVSASRLPSPCAVLSKAEVWADAGCHWTAQSLQLWNLGELPSSLRKLWVGLTPHMPHVYLCDCTLFDSACLTYVQYCCQFGLPACWSVKRRCVCRGGCRRGTQAGCGDGDGARGPWQGGPPALLCTCCLLLHSTHAPLYLTCYLPLCMQTWCMHWSHQLPVGPTHERQHV